MAECTSHRNTTVEEVYSGSTSSLIKPSRSQCAAIAGDTLEKLNAGWYCPDRSSRIDIEEDISFCVKNSLLYTEDDLKNTTRPDLPVDDGVSSSYPKIEVRHCTTLQAAESLVVEMGKDNVGVLNFASAKNPGGGFQKGAAAQEESLARSSSLYWALSQEPFLTEFYDYHRRSRSCIYSHRMIYSPRVIVFKNDNGQLLPSPYHVGIVTSAAPNASVVRDQSAIRNAMAERVKRVLHAFKANKHVTLVLGAFGCGVLKNNPFEVALTFRRYLESEEFKNAFTHIIFAVSNFQMYRTFQQVFAAADLKDIRQQNADVLLTNGEHQPQRNPTKSRRGANYGYNQARQRKYQNNHYDDHGDE